MIDKEVALHNMANYNNYNNLIFLLQNYHNLRNMCYRGNQTAICICLDLELAMNNEYLTEKQKKALKLKFFYKETNAYISEEMNVSENAVRKYIKGGIKRMSKILRG
jgi:DNA-directed RNA polymerase specialized sigma subunit